MGTNKRRRFTTRNHVVAAVAVDAVADVVIAVADAVSDAVAADTTPNMFPR